MFDTCQEMDKIVIKDLCAHCIIGVYEHERQEPQPILINITIFTNTHKAATTDTIEDCLDYDALAHRVHTFVERSARFTIEALAEDLANLCFETPGVDHVGIRVEKPEALEFVASVGVEIERDRKSRPKPGLILESDDRLPG